MKLLIFFILIFWIIPLILLLIYFRYFDTDKVSSDYYKEELIYLISIPILNFLVLISGLICLIFAIPYKLAYWYLFGDKNSLKDKRGYRL